MTTYDADFFKYVNSGAINSAKHIIPLLMDSISPTSVLDVGCGQGAWLSVWHNLGINDLTGLDGDYVDRKLLLFPQEHFLPYSLTNSFDLKRRFDLVQSLEVAEHLPAASAYTFIESLVKHSDLILFSAAAKGQGGDQHINEQDYQYWRDIFASFGYFPIDYLRPIIKNNTLVEPWYRYNSFLYCTPECLQKLPDNIKKHVVAQNEQLLDISPLPYKVRKKVIALLTPAMMTRIAKIKEFVITAIRSKSKNK